MSSRYGWSSRPGLSPFNSTLGDGSIPAVTDDDYSYITSEDLENTSGLAYGSHSRDIDSFGHSAPVASSFDQYEKPEDDVILIKHRGVIYPEHFPAYSIGDGQLYVNDVVERVRYMFRIPERDTDRIRLLYKGRHLANSNTPVRDYGVKDNSEVSVFFNDRPGNSSDSSEEIVVVGRDSRGEQDEPRKSRKDKGRRGKDRSPRDSNSSFTLEVPGTDDRRRGVSRVRTQSPPSGSRPSSASAIPSSSPPAVPGGPIEKLNNISSHFNTKLLPLCLQYTMNPPSDPKKREEEHRKLSETVMQQVLLKLDEIDTAGEEGARAHRKALVQQVQHVLKGLDEKLKG